MSCGNQFHDVGINDDCGSIPEEWKSANDVHSRAFLTHSWWETQIEIPNNNKSVRDSGDHNDVATQNEHRRDLSRASDWFPSMGTAAVMECNVADPDGIQIEESNKDLRDRCGRFGWVYKPEGVAIESAAQGPNTIDRLAWFLSANRTRLLRDLLEVVNLKNINHENICCLNTAVVITIFANRRQELHELLRDLKQMNDEDTSYFHRAKMAEGHAATSGEIENRHNIMKNFREVLWFWIEYYTHRGRDRLSLEFSSRLRFQEWMEVVTLLSADNGAPTSLVRRPLRLPRSPYPRVT